MKKEDTGKIRDVAYLSALKSKLSVYSIGLQKAKRRHDGDGAKKWADGMAAIRKEIITLSETIKKPAGS
jgi:hypothetical protein